MNKYKYFNCLNIILSFVFLVYFAHIVLAFDFPINKMYVNILFHFSFIIAMFYDSYLMKYYKIENDGKIYIMLLLETINLLCNNSLLLLLESILLFFKYLEFDYILTYGYS